MKAISRPRFASGEAEALSPVTINPLRRVSAQIRGEDVIRFFKRYLWPLTVSCMMTAAVLFLVVNAIPRGKPPCSDGYICERRQ